MITEDYVSFETAKLLKEKGFDKYPLFPCYKEDNGEFIDIPTTLDTINYCFITAPTIQMTMKWLREVHKLFIELKMSIDLIGNPHYAYSVLGFDGKYKRENYTSFDWMFKDACEAAIKYCLEKLI